MTAPSDVIRKHIEAFNARDQGAEPWSAGAEMVSPAGTVTGRDQVLAFLGVFQEAFPRRAARDQAAARRRPSSRRRRWLPWHPQRRAACSGR